MVTLRKGGGGGETSECVRMVCNSWLMTSLLQVVSRLVHVGCQNLLSTGLLQVVSASRNKSANNKL